MSIVIYLSDFVGVAVNGLAIVLCGVDIQTNKWVVSTFSLVALLSACGGDSDGGTTEISLKPRTTACTAPSNTAAFDYSGTDQTWVVPEGVTCVEFKLWGAGGGLGLGAQPGGGGGFIYQAFDVPPRTYVTIIVGQAGANAQIKTYGGGGKSEQYSCSGQGGGRSEIVMNNVTYLIAGAGGGGGCDSGTGNGGGAGGGLEGQACFGPTAGGGGTQTSGGSGGVAGSGNTAGLPGDVGVGGDAVDNGCDPGGAGGGGHYGGGSAGAGCGLPDDDTGGGGGGSSYFTGTVLSNVRGVGPSAAGTSDPDYANNSGRGGQNGMAAGDGRVFVIY